MTTKYVRFQTGNGDYIYVEEGCRRKCVFVGPQRNRTPRSTFELEFLDPNEEYLHDGSHIALKHIQYGQTNFDRTYTYVGAEWGGGREVDARRAARAQHETFTLVALTPIGADREIHSGGKVALKTYDGHYLSAHRGSGDFLEATGTSAGSSETFTLELSDRPPTRDTPQPYIPTWTTG